MSVDEKGDHARARHLGTVISIYYTRRLFIHTHTHTLTHKHTYTRAQTHMHTLAYTHARTHIHTHSHTNTIKSTLTPSHPYTHKHTLTLYRSIRGIEKPLYKGKLRFFDPKTAVYLISHSREFKLVPNRYLTSKL